MGAKTSMLVYADGEARKHLAAMPSIDRPASLAPAEALFPKHRLQPLTDGSLGWTHPPGRELLAGSFPGVDILAAKEFAIDRPSRLAPRFLAHAGPRAVMLHTMHSMVDWFAFGIWRGGQLVRSLSLAPDNGVIEDIGERLDFELPFWQGKHPADDPDDAEDGAARYPLPFHPLDLGDTALRALFGYQLEGFVDPTLLDADRIPLMRFRRRRSWLGLG